MFLIKGVLKKFHKVYRKTAVLESVFNKVAGLQACKFIKKETPVQVCLSEFRIFFKNTYLVELLRAAGFDLQAIG